ncbi:MAG: hypothetical protein RJB30_499 [Actinomycetota bacterium]
MDLTQILDSLRVVQLPMRTKFRGLTVREVALFQGPQGWGEFSPFIEYGDREARFWLDSAIEAAFSESPKLFRNQVRINGTIPELDDRDEIADLVARYPGVDTFKIKVGGDLRRDLARIATVHSIAPEAKLRVDVNGSWSVNDAIFNIRTIFGEVTGNYLEYVEQPVATLAELRELKERLLVDVKIAGDEVIRKSEDPFALQLSGAIDVMMLKVAPIGGINRALALAAHHGLPVVVSSALESVIGIGHGLRLAAALPELDYACGLGTGALFQADLGRLPITNGNITISSLEPDLEALKDFAAPIERIEWWRDRIRRVWEVVR